MPTTAINLNLEAGERVTLQPVSWQRFEGILQQLGTRRASRIVYANGILEIVAPLPEHERAKIALADLVKALLKAQKRRWEPLGSTTFKRESMAAGIEPDDCFYIQNYQAVIGKKRLDLNIDPPPDLAIEIEGAIARIEGGWDCDAPLAMTGWTSKTVVDAYVALGVPELWIYARGKLTINLLQEGEYIDSETSNIFPGIAIKEIIPRFMNRANVVGVSQALEEFEVL